MKTKLFLLTTLLLPISFLFMAQPNYRQSGDVTPASTIDVADEMAPVPDDCGLLADEIAIDPLIQNAVGAWPIWIALPNWEGESKGILIVPNEHNQANPMLDGWWSTKVGWFIAQSYTGDVRIQGFNIADQSPMYIEFADEPRTLATINPAEPGGFVEELVNFAFFPSYVWVSKAGCYRIQAEWDGGRWEQVIAVGSVE